MAKLDSETRIPPRLVVGLVLGLLIVVFIAENNRRTKMRFLLPEVTAPLWTAISPGPSAPSVGAVPRSACVIEYDATFVFPVSVSHLWATMARVDCYSSWWSWLDEFSADGAGLKRGTVLHGIVVPPLPYRMRLDVVLEDCVPERSITALVHGDLEGAAQLTFDGDDAETRARATWTIEMMQRPMRMAARIAPPLLRWGHDRVVEATVDGFRRQVLEEGRR